MARMTPSEAFVETMVANKVTDMFGIMGSAFMDAMDIFAPAGIRLIPVVHEQGAAHMADGYSRVSGRHGVTIGQNGPGISNCVTGIAAAYWAHTPVVIVTPEAGTMGIGLGGFQEGNQLPMFQEHTKYQGHVCHPARMAEFTGRCFDRAMAEMGPTQLNIPRDYFYGDIDVEIPQPRRLDRGPGGESSLNEAADLLAKAEFPVIISGGGVVMADAVDECRELAERLGAPVVNSYLRFEKPRSFFAAMSWGNCGYAFPTIIGAKAAAPDRPAISYAGDGAWGMSMMETLTCVRHNIPVTAVVFHNRQWGAEKKNQVDFYNRRFAAAELENESWAQIARSMGAEGIRVDSLAEVGPALKKAVDMQMNEGKTTIVEIMCTRELGDPFRRDALSKPVRYLAKYKDYT